VPVKYSYPGVYVEELPSGVRTIGGVSTSVAAFIGWADQGPTDRPVLCLSYSDFDRQFGGLDPRSYLGYAVSHFFANGGTQAHVIRLAGDNSKAATATIDGLTLTASGPGTWAHTYKLVTTPRKDDAKRFRADIVRKADGAIAETFVNLSLDPNDTRSAQSVLDGESQLVTVTTMDATKAVTGKEQDFGGGVDDATPLEPGDANFIKALLGDNDTTGAYRLKRADFNLLCVPGHADATSLKALETLCAARRAMLIVDAAEDDTYAKLKDGSEVTALNGPDARNGALYFPWIKAPDPLQEGRLRPFPPSGAIAGVYARTDASRGVWKAPAGTDASLGGVAGLVEVLTDDENGILNPLAINCLRQFPVYGNIVWGARTLVGNDDVGSEWKYVPVRRTALYIEESLFRGLKWAVFEPNDEPLWAQIRLNVGSFMHELFRKGAFQGATPRDAYFVKCDKETTTQADIDRGIVNIIVGFAPLKPAEFVVIQIQQMAGQLAV
jgi:uncharacterized protein